MFSPQVTRDRDAVWVGCLGMLDRVLDMLSETMDLTVASPTTPEDVGGCCEVERKEERGEVLLPSWRQRWQGLGRGAAAVNDK